MTSTANAASEHEAQSFSKQSHNRHVLRYWLWELFSLVIALGLFAAIVTVLLKYDGEQLPSWPYSINLNTLIALMSTVLRASLAVIVAEIIGQSKWVWLTAGARPLRQLQVFDDASRGMPGSLNLIGMLRFGLRGSPLPLLSALVMVLSITVGPFTQQALKTVPCRKAGSSGSASLPVANAAPGPDVYSDSSYVLVGPGMKAAIMNSLMNIDENDNSAVPVTCPTGNCTFQEHLGVSHSTIGVCNKCVDTTDLVSVDFDNPPEDGTEATLRLDDIWIRPSLGHPMPWLAIGSTNMSFAESVMTPEFRDVARLSYGNFSVLSLSASPCEGSQECPHKITTSSSSLADTDFVAATCTIYPCMKNIAAKVENGRLEETIISTQPAVKKEMKRRYDQAIGPEYADSFDRVTVKQPCLIDNELYDASNFSLVPNITSQRAFVDLTIDKEEVSVPTDCVYQVYGLYATSLNRYLEDFVLNGSCSVYYGAPGFSCKQAVWLEHFYGTMNATFETLDASFENLATGMTNYMRKDGWGVLNDTSYYEDSLTGSLPRPSKGAISGQADEVTVCVQLDWPWLLFPATLSLVTTFLLTAMLVANHIDQRQPVWKSSLLPLLLYGPSNESEHVAIDIHKAAAEKKVRFHPGTELVQPRFVMLEEAQLDKDATRVETDSLLETEDASTILFHSDRQAHQALAK